MMQIGSSSQSYYDPWDMYDLPEVENPILETPSADPSDKEKGNVAATDTGQFGSDSTYEDPWRAGAGLPIFGYKLNDPEATGFGSDASKGITGLGDALNAQREDAQDTFPGISENENASAASSLDDRGLSAFEDRDQEVRSHEMAHLAAAGGLARGGMQLDYQIGPDGKPYAVGGSVQIDTSKGSTPEETLTKAAQIEAAAMAPANPSAQDLKVASDARRMALEARQEIAERSREAAEPLAEGESPSGSSPFAEQITRVYGSPVSKDASEPAFVAVA